MDELVAKGVIGFNLPGEQPWCIMQILIVLSVQSRQPYQVCLNTVLVNKVMAKYQCQLNDIGQCRAKLWWAKWVSMLDLKGGFHNILFKSTSSYISAFITYSGEFWWLRMPMVLI